MVALLTASMLATLEFKSGKGSEEAVAGSVEEAALIDEDVDDAVGESSSVMIGVGAGIVAKGEEEEEEEEEDEEEATDDKDEAGVDREEERIALVCDICCDRVVF